MHTDHSSRQTTYLTYHQELSPFYLYHHCTVALSSSYCLVIIIVLSRYHHRTVAFSSSYCRVIIIVLSRFHHRTVALSPSYCRVITIVLSRFHHRTIAFRGSMLLTVLTLPSLRKIIYDTSIRHTKVGSSCTLHKIKLYRHGIDSVQVGEQGRRCDLCLVV